MRKLRRRRWRMSPASYSSRTTSTIFMAKTDPDKLAGILAKTWNKMSPSGRDAALKLALPPAIPALLQQGLARFPRKPLSRPN
jgi:hypothetical protein